jgi:hypothetical protein
MWPNCTNESSPYAGEHVDCLQMLGGDNITISSSRLVNCDGGTWMNGIGKGATYSNITVENSMFEGHVLALTCGGGCDGGGYAVSGFVHLYYNTIFDGSYFQDWQPGGDYRMIGNIFGDVPPNHGSCTIEGTSGNAGASFTVASYNMFGSGAGSCGPTNFNSTARYINGSNGAAGIDLRLQSGSVAIGKGDPAFRPAADLFGTPRPVHMRADVGAWQHLSAGLVIGSSIGPVRLGMGKKDVDAALGAPTHVGRTRNGLRSSSYGRPSERIVVTYDGNDRVATIATSSRYYSTVSGLGVGSPVDDAHSLGQLAWRSCTRSRYGIHAGRGVDIAASRRTGGRITRIAFGLPSAMPSCR